MTRLMKLQLRQSELRQQIAGMLDTDTETRSETFSDDLGKLTREARSLEGEVQAAIVSEPEPETRAADPAGNELRSMLDRADLGHIFSAALERRGIDGVERELQAHYGLAANQVPLELLERRAVSSAPTNVGTNQAAIIPMVFPSSVGAFLGVSMPTVPVGESVYPVLTAGAAPQTPAENADTNPTEDTATFSAEVLKGGRLQTSFLYSREDAARFAGLDAALRMNLSDALSDALDKEIVVGTNGLLTGTNLANHTVSAATGFGSYRSGLCYGRIDGKYASEESDIRLVVGEETLGDMAASYQTAGSGEVSALDSLRSVGVQVRVSAHVPDVASARQNVIIRRGLREDMVAPIWQGITIIPDEITQIGKGQIRVTAIMLFAVKLLRAGGFYKQQVQH